MNCSVGCLYFIRLLARTHSVSLENVRETARRLMYVGDRGCECQWLTSMHISVKLRVKTGIPESF